MADWLTCQNLSQYTGGFLEKQIGGRILLELDSAKMKVQCVDIHAAGFVLWLRVFAGSPYGDCNVTFLYLQDAATVTLVCWFRVWE